MAMADVHGSPGAPGLQMPQMGGPGPAPVPYPGGRDEAAGSPPVYGAAPLDMAPADGYVLHGVTGLNTAQDPSAHTLDGNPGPSGLVAPFYAGGIDPIYAAGDSDAGGRSPLADSVAGAVANSTGRWQDLQSDTFKDGPRIGTAVQGPTAVGPQQQGSVIGDLMHFPSSPLDPGAGVGNTLPTAAFFDPDRDYGGAQGAPGYQGEAQ